MRPIFITKNLAAPVANGICTTQNRSTAGALTIDGNLSSANVATLDTQRRLGITTATGNLASLLFNVTGTNDQGQVIGESITGPNNSTVSSVLDYKTVTGVTVSGNMAGVDANVGTTSVGATAPIPLDQYIAPFNASLGIELVTGSGNASIQATRDDVFNAANLNVATGLNWSNVTGGTGAANTYTSLGTPEGAVRLQINSGTGTWKIVVRQAGMRY